MLAPLPKDLSLGWRPTKIPCRFHWLVFIVASLAAAVVLVSIVAIPQWLSKQARWEALRSHVGEMGRVAASVIDGDLHRQLLDPTTYRDELYARALKPLVRLHSAYPDIFYLYTMVDRGGVAYFVLDTATSPDLRTDHKLRPSAYNERFEVRAANNDDWLARVAAGNTYVTPTFEEDDFGTFLTAHAPIYDSESRYSGFVGVDFDVQYYLTREARFRSIAIATLGAALVLALAIGYLLARYYSAMHGRMQQLYDSSIRDSLTGLLNRRGALDTIGKSSLARHPTSNAMLIVDIDNLKIINDLRGHANGDAAIALTALAVRESIRAGDECARFGGDEFLIFAPDCDSDKAAEIARTIIARLSRQSMSLAGARVSVSIGIVVQDGAHADFAQMYRDADTALYQAREEGKSRIGVFAPPMTSSVSPF
jgi:diguanylate cyclase (GGDEF)-like protein